MQTMESASTYFGNIKDAVSSIFEGLAVTASHLMRKPYTVQYPDRVPVRIQDTLPFRYRGILEVNMDICTGCLACERACPIDCIVIVVEKDKQTRQMLISQFDIDIAKCMYCGLCSEPCPTGAIHHTTEFEGADFSLESIMSKDEILLQAFAHGHQFIWALTYGAAGLTSFYMFRQVYMTFFGRVSRHA